MNKTIVIAIALAFFVAVSRNSQASLIYGITGAVVSQDFDTLATSGTANTWTNNTTLPGWYASLATYRGDSGAANAGALYSFGVAGTGPLTDRALGGIASGTAQARWGIQFQNTTGGTLDSMTIRYDGEQWRNGGNTTAQSLTFDYVTGAAVHSITAATGTLAPSLNFTGPIATATAGALDGNLAANRTAGITFTVTGLTWNNGDFLMLRWTDLNDTGNDHGLAIDNFSFSAVPEPSSLILAGLIGLVGFKRRRR